MIVVVEAQPAAVEALRGAIGLPCHVVADLDELRLTLLQDASVDVVVIGSRVPEGDALDLADDVRVSRPALGVVLTRPRLTATTLAAALRAGVREVVREKDHAGLRDAVGRALELARAVRGRPGADPDPSEDATPRGQVVTVFSAKGGCGKTMLATNLAAALAAGGRHRVCLVDIDLAFGDVGIALQLAPARTVLDGVPMAGSLDEQALRSLLVAHPCGLMALLAPVEPGGADLVPPSLVVEVLRLLRGMFDVVVVDTPASFSDHVLAAFDESDRVVLLATLEIPALKNLRLTLQTLDLLGFPRARLDVVINRSDSKVGLSMAEVETTLGTPVTGQIPSSLDVPSTINRGVPIVLDQPAHPVSVAINALAGRQLAGGAELPIPEQRSGRIHNVLRWLERQA